VAEGVQQPPIPMNAAVLFSPTVEECQLPLSEEEASWQSSAVLGARLILSNHKAQCLARAWLEAWNSRDLDRLAAMYAEDCELSSPLVSILTQEPGGRLFGKRQIIPFLRLLMRREDQSLCELFTVYRGVKSLTISYRSFLGKNTLEQLELDQAGQIVRSTSSFDQIA